jgi:hypothetical protein
MIRRNICVYATLDTFVSMTGMHTRLYRYARPTNIIF